MKRMAFCTQWWDCFVKAIAQSLYTIPMFLVDGKFGWQSGCQSSDRLSAVILNKLVWYMSSDISCASFSHFWTGNDFVNSANIDWVILLFCVKCFLCMLCIAMPLSGAERQRRYRNKVKMNPQTHEAYKKKKHEYYVKARNLLLY